MGEIKVGFVTAYDQNTMTAVIQPEGLGGIIKDVVCLFDRYDPKNGAFSFRAPSENSPCLYTTIKGTTYLLGLFPPENMTEEGSKFESLYGNTTNRTPPGMLQPIVKPGNTIDTNSMGSEDTFTDTMKKIIMFPKKLYSIWNIMNCIWENMCMIFRLYSAPLDVTAEVTKDDECNTTVKVRKVVKEREEDATTMIDLRMGKDADIIQMNINGKPFIHVDGDRNVIIMAGNIDLNAKNINYNSDTFNCLNVGRVDLP